MGQPLPLRPLGPFLASLSLGPSLGPSLGQASLSLQHAACIRRIKAVS